MGRGRLTLYIATSVDGFIATEDGGVGWLEAFQQEADADSSSEETVEGYDAFFADVDALVLGSRTYEQVLDFGWPYGDKPTFVLTTRSLPRAHENVELVDGPVGTLATRLRERFEHVWVVGGAEVARSFLAAGAIDEMRLSLVPILLGKGIGLFGQDAEQRSMDLLAINRHASGIVELHYRLDAP